MMEIIGAFLFFSNMKYKPIGANNISEDIKIIKAVSIGEINEAQTDPYPPIG